MPAESAPSVAQHAHLGRRLVRAGRASRRTRPRAASRPTSRAGRLRRARAAPGRTRRVMSGKRGPSASSLGPRSGEPRSRFDVIADQHHDRRPAASVASTPPAALVMTSVLAPSAISTRAGNATRASAVPLVHVDAALHRDAARRRRARRARGCPRGRRSSSAGSPGSRRSRPRRASASVSANAPSPEPRIEPDRRRAPAGSARAHRVDGASVELARRARRSSDHLEDQRPRRRRRRGPITNARAISRSRTSATLPSPIARLREDRDAAAPGSTRSPTFAIDDAPRRRDRSRPPCASRPAPSRSAAMPSASPSIAARARRRRSTLSCAGCGSHAGGSRAGIAALRLDAACGSTSSADAVAERPRDPRAPSSASRRHAAEHAASRRRARASARTRSGAPRAAQHLDRLVHLERVADRSGRAAGPCR